MNQQAAQEINRDKMPIKDFCTLAGKNRRQVYRLYDQYPRLKVHLPGEKESRVNITEWNRILGRA